MEAQAAPVAAPVAGNWSGVGVPNPSKTEGAHIPLSEWIIWREWNRR